MKIRDLGLCCLFSCKRKKSFCSLNKKFTEATHSLVRTIGAVEFAIAPPLRCNAVLLGTLELLDRIAFRWSTFSFIGSIAAIVVSVANPSALDASSVATGELVGPASVVCE